MRETAKYPGPPHPRNFVAKLSDTRMRGIKPRAKRFRLFDGEGLFLIVTPQGGRWWRQRYRWAGKERSLSLETYPETSLLQARGKGVAVRNQAANGIDPSAERQQETVQLDALLRAIEAYPGGLVVRQALRFAALAFVRPADLREAQWHEFDLNDKHPECRIPAERMKMGGHPIVPLAHQAMEVLGELYSLTGPEGYVFPSVRNALRPISDNHQCSTPNVRIQCRAADRARFPCYGEYTFERAGVESGRD